MAMKSAIGTYEVMLDINGIYAFIDKEVLSQEEEDVWEEPYQLLPDSPDMGDVVDQ